MRSSGEAHQSSDHIKLMLSGSPGDSSNSPGSNGPDLARCLSDCRFASALARVWLEPISKSSEEDNEAGELDESEEVLGVILPADEDAALPLDPRKEAFDEPTTHVAA